jgi:5-methylcytosine-specific restriction endonuclease McrA
MKDYFGLTKKEKEFLYGTKKKQPGDNKDSRRSFTQSQKNEICDRQKNRCAKCKAHLLKAATHYDHIKPYSKNGKTEVNNGQALCSNCHSVKSNKDQLKKVNVKRTSKIKKPRIGLCY